MTEAVPFRFGDWTFVRRRSRLWAEARQQGFLLDGLGHGSLRIRNDQSAFILLLDGRQMAWARPEPIRPRSSLPAPMGEGQLGFWKWRGADGRLRFEHEQSKRSVVLESSRDIIMVEDGPRSYRFPDQPPALKLECRRGVLTFASPLELSDRQLELLKLLLEAARLSEAELQEQKGRRAPGQLEELRIELAERRIPLITKSSGVYGLDLDHDQVTWLPND